MDDSTGRPLGRSDRTIFWDFEGTLAVRAGIWDQCLVDVLDQLEPGHGRAAADFEPWLRTGFPWHDWQRQHPELADPDAWWDALRPVLRAACVGAGLDPGVAHDVAAAVRDCYTDPGYWRVYADVRPVLESLRAAGWRHAIVSNHVPELPRLVSALGIDDLMDAVLTSALTGAEKPNPRMFAAAMAALGHPAASWMIGDNVVADVQGAEAAGIAAILVRVRSPRASRQADDLRGAARLVMAGQ